MIQFENTKEAITINDLLSFEVNYNVKLPESYKSHLLKFNGGYPSSDIYYGDFNLPIDSFLSLKNGNQTIEKSLKSLDHVLKTGEVPFATSTSGTIYMSLSSKDYGYIYVAFSDWEPELLSKSFDEFIEEFHEGEV